MKNNDVIELDLDKVEVPESWVYEVRKGKNGVDANQMQKDIKAELIEGVKQSDRMQESIYNNPFLKPFAVYPKNFPF